MRSGHSRDRVSIAIAWLLAACASAIARGHAYNESYIWLNVDDDRLSGRVEVRLDDLRRHLGLDLPTDVAGARAALVASSPVVEAYIRDRFAIEVSGAPLAYEFVRTDLGEAPRFGHFAQYSYETATTPIPDQFGIRNDLFFDADPMQRSLLCIAYDRPLGKEYGEEYTVAVFSGAKPVQTVDRVEHQVLAMPRAIARIGLREMSTNAGSLLFLAALLLPVAMIREDREDREDRAGPWRPAGFGATLRNGLMVLIPLAAAHTLAVGLAMLGVAALSPTFVAVLGAASIVVAAASNLFPSLRPSLVALVFLFGLVHGLGLAERLLELPFRMGYAIRVFVAYAGGLQVTQFAAAAVIIALVFAVRRAALYPNLVLRGGSLALVAAGLVLGLDGAVGIWS